MAFFNFVDQVGPPIPAVYLNALDNLRNVLTADQNHFITVTGAPLSGVGNPQLIIGTRPAPLVQPSFAGIYLSDPFGTTGMALHNVNPANTAINFGIELGNNNPGDALAGGITSSTYIGPYFSNMPAGPMVFLNSITTAYTMGFGCGAKASFALGSSGGAPFIQGGAATAAGMIDMTPDNGTFTGTLTGMTTTVTGTFNWERIGRKVTIWLEGISISGTSNATSFTVTGVPVSISPFNSRQTTCYAVQDNTLTGIVAGVVVIGGGGGSATISFGKFNAATGQWQGSNWTASGTKGLQNGWMITYIL